MTAGENLGALLDAAADAWPDAIAVIDDRKAVTYSVLREQINALTERIELLTRPQEPVAVLMSPSVDAVATLHAIVKSGRVAIPLDERAPQAVVAAMIEHAGARVAITEDGPEVGDGPTATLAGAAVYYTSGSTGSPKAFVVEEAALVHLAQSCALAYGITHNDRAALVFHHSFGASRVAVLGALASGAAVRVYDARRITPDDLAAKLEDDRVTFLHCSPALLRGLVADFDPGSHLPSLRLLATGADALTLADVRLVRSRMSPKSVLAQTYATSETGPIAAFFIEGGATIDTSLVPVGAPVPGKQVRIENPDEHGIGEIVVGGTGLASGYLRDAAMTAARFGADESGARVFRTGDRGRLRPDGVLEHHGRRDHVVKVNGFTVDGDEVERALRSLDDVLDAAVRFEPEPRPRLVAYLVASNTPTPTVSAIRGALATRLAGHLIPAAYVFLDRLPRDHRGKLDRNRLPPTPTARPDLVTPFAPSRDDLERFLAHIFESVLGVGPVGVDDDFFDLGGDSLAAVEVVHAIQEDLGRTVTTSAFLDATTVAALADRLRLGGGADVIDPVVTLSRGGARAPFVCVHGGDGTVLSFAVLAGALATDRPVFALELGGVPIRRLVTVGRLASYYITSLRRRAIEPPLVLSGYSTGASVAFEMARRLAAEGRPPGLVVLVDPRRKRPPPARRHALRWHARRRRQLMLRRIELARRGVRRAGELDPKAVWQLTMLVNTQYRPRRYAGDVLVITTDSEVSAREEWAPLVLGHLEVVRIVGDHNALLEVPTASELAHHIESALGALGL